MIKKKQPRKLLILLILIIIIITIISVIRGTLSRYTSQTISSLDFSIAYSVVDFDVFEIDNLSIPKLYPSDDKFEFDLCTVSNFETQSGGTYKKTKAAMGYELVLTVTTNLPLNYEVKRYRTHGGDASVLASQAGTESSCNTSERIIQDANGVFYKEITIKSTATQKIQLGVGDYELDKFKLYVEFPKSKDDESFADLIESAQLKIDARQITE